VLRVGRIGETRVRRAETLDGNRIGLDWPVDVLEYSWSEVLEGEWECFLDLLVNRAGDAHCPWLGDLLEACADIDPVSEQISPAGYDIAHVDSNPELDTAVRSGLSARFQQPTLDRNGTLNGVDCARELRQDAVPCGVGNPAAMLLNESVHDLTSGSEALQGAKFVQANEPRVARDIGRKDRGKVSCNPLFLLRTHPSSAL
jgi:hypothetical protein